MRDPKRIKKVCKLLEEFWSHFPEQRLGQLLLNWIVRDLISYLNLLEKDIKYPINTILKDFKRYGYTLEELKFYLGEIIKIKNGTPTSLTQDENILSLAKQFIPDYIVKNSTITIQKTVFYDNFDDYEKAIIFIGRISPFFEDIYEKSDSIAVPKGFKTSNFSKAKGFFYKKEIWSNRYYLTEFGDRKFFQIASQIEEKINEYLEL